MWISRVPGAEPACTLAHGTFARPVHWTCTTASYFDAALGLIKMIGPFVLLAVLAYAVWFWHTRAKTADEVGEREARRLYTDERAQRDNLPGEQSGCPPARPT